MNEVHVTSSLSADPEQLQGPRITRRQHAFDPCMLGCNEIRICVEHSLRLVARNKIERLVAQRVGDLKGCFPALALAKQISHSAQAKILARDLESVFRACEYRKTLGGIIANVAEQNAVRRIRTATNASPQLMQL